MFALVGHILFGSSDYAFYTFGESIFTTFLMLIGQQSPFEIYTNRTTGRTLYGIAFTLTTILLLNILLASIIAHYIEFYIDTFGEEIGIITMFKEIILDEKYTNVDYSTLNFGGKVKFKIINWLRKFIKDLNHESNEKELFKVDHLKKISKGEDNIALVPKHIVDLVLRPNNKILNNRLNFYTHTQIQEAMKNVYFWMELIDTTLIRTTGFGIFNDNVADDNISIEHHLLRDDHYHPDDYDEYILAFMMNSYEFKMNIWRK